MVIKGQEDMIKRKLTLIMENKPGALVRVVGLFHQRGYNIESLHVDPVDDFTPYKLSLIHI